MGRSLSPDPVDQTVAGDRAIGVQQEHSQRQPLLRAAEIDHATACAYLERPEDRELHDATQTHLQRVFQDVATPQRHGPTVIDPEEAHLNSRLILLSVLALATGAVPAALGFRGDTTFTVSSSLDGKSVLPTRSHWLAYTDLPPAQVAEVDFVIDGTVRWIEHQAPYNYASDEKGKKMGFLITTWIKPGIHHFAVRVVSNDGQKNTDAFDARVVAGPQPPPQLAGTWRRVPPKTDPSPWAGKPWILWFDRVGEWHIDFTGGGVLDQYDVRGHVLNVYAPIQTGPFDVSGGKCTGLGCTKIRRNGHSYSTWGNDCDMSGPFGSYRWSVSNSTLTLKSIHEGCKARNSILTGTWTRIA